MSEAPIEAQPQAGTDPATVPATGSQQQPQGTLDNLPEWARKEIKALRRENGGYRTEKQQRDQAEMTEAQRAKAERDTFAQERDTLKNQLRTMRAQTAIAAAGAEYPDLVADKLDPDVLDSGDAKDITKEVERIRKQYPNLFRATTGTIEGGTRGVDAPAPTRTFGKDTLTAAYEQAERQGRR